MTRNLSFDSAFLLLALFTGKLSPFGDKTPVLHSMSLLTQGKRASILCSKSYELQFLLVQTGLLCPSLSQLPRLVRLVPPCPLLKIRVVSAPLNYVDQEWEWYSFLKEEGMDALQVVTGTTDVYFGWVSVCLKQYCGNVYVF